MHSATCCVLAKHWRLLTRRGSHVPRYLVDEGMVNQMHHGPLRSTITHAELDPVALPSTVDGLLPAIKMTSHTVCPHSQRLALDELAKMILLLAQTRMKVSGLCPLFALLASCLRSPRSEMGMDDLSATLGASMIVADSHTVGKRVHSDLSVRRQRWPSYSREVVATDAIIMSQTDRHAKGICFSDPLG